MQDRETTTLPSIPPSILVERLSAIHLQQQQASLLNVSTPVVDASTETHTNRQRAVYLHAVQPRDASLPHSGRDDLARGLDGVHEQREVARGLLVPVLAVQDEAREGHGVVVRRLHECRGKCAAHHGVRPKGGGGTQG